MGARRVRDPWQRGARLHESDQLFQRVTEAPAAPVPAPKDAGLVPNLPVPEVYELQLSDSVFDALFGPREGPGWADTTTDLPERFTDFG